MTRLIVPALALCLAACQGRDDSERDARVTASECKGEDRSPPEDSGSSGASEATLSAEVIVDNIVLVLSDVNANCCPSPGARVEVGDDTIRVDVTDVTDGEPCRCTCRMDFTVEVVDVEPGDWLVDVYFNGDYVDALALTLEPI